MFLVSGVSKILYSSMASTNRPTTGGKSPALVAQHLLEETQQLQRQIDAAKQKNAAPARSGKTPIGLRHRKALRDNRLGITKPAIRRLARRGGVVRLSGLIYDEIRTVLAGQGPEDRRELAAFLPRVLHDAMLLADYRGAKTVTAVDVVYALRKSGRIFYSADHQVAAALTRG